MKFSLRRSISAACLPLVLAIGHASAATPAADADFAALQALQDRLPPWVVVGADGKRQVGTPPPASEAVLWREISARETTAAALAFVAAHPTDPRRWDAALIALRTDRVFVQELKPGYDAAVAARDSARIRSLIVRDEAAAAAWEERMARLLADLLAAPDASPAVIGAAVDHACYRATLDRTLTPAATLARMRELLGAGERRAPDEERLASAYDHYFRILQRHEPAALPGELARVAQSRNPVVAQRAQGWQNLEGARAQSVEMKFTAIDGREVDLAQLRGKVVPIDFWATWCGPCKEELPNIKRVYAAYHARGFEVVGIALDKAEDRRKLIDCCRDHDLPWPQHFDGKFWKNEFAVKYAVRAIPAMFLLDRDGKVATTEARGDKLEPAVKRLLGL